MRLLEDEPRPIGVTLISPRVFDHTTIAHVHHGQMGYHVASASGRSSHAQAMLRRIREDA